MFGFPTTRSVARGGMRPRPLRSASPSASAITSSARSSASSETSRLALPGCMASGAVVHPASPLVPVMVSGSPSSGWKRSSKDTAASVAKPASSLKR